MPLGDGHLADAIGTKFPIAGAVLSILGPTMVAAIKTGDPVKIEDAARQDPAVINNLNLEGPLQSGTTLGMAGALLTSLGAIWAMVAAGNLDPAVLGPLIATVLASLFGLWRRWGSGLKPLFTRRK